MFECSFGVCCRIDLGDIGTFRGHLLLLLILLLLFSSLYLLLLLLLLLLWLLLLPVSWWRHSILWRAVLLRRRHTALTHTSHWRSLVKFAIRVVVRSCVGVLRPELDHVLNHALCSLNVHRPAPQQNVARLRVLLHIHPATATDLDVIYRDSPLSYDNSDLVLGDWVVRCRLRSRSLGAAGLWGPHHMLLSYPPLHLSSPMSRHVCVLLP
mmetsp:Transcript_17904/g.37221  ORF Transcript_17904/g.37221 Transcript_17904/m.37221 type:complete len:210 (-) Transcript_17904:18-647(-)